MKLTEHLRVPRVKVDWRKVWEAFKAKHGVPVPWKNVLLFPDGWTHGAADYRGPHFPPPTDANELRLMKLAYWSIRRKLCEVERRYLWEAIQGIRNVQRSYEVDVPFYITLPMRDDETGTLKFRRVPVNPDEWEAGRLAWLTNNVAECDLHLRELQNGKEADTAAQAR